MLELYHAERCPYCVRVRQFLEDKSVAYISKPVPTGSAMSPLKEELLRVGGKGQVPFLVDPERKTSLYESADIIKYISTHYVK